MNKLLVFRGVNGLTTDLGPWWQSLQLNWPTEAVMVFQFVLHLVFEEDKLKTTPVTVEGLVDLKRAER